MAERNIFDRIGIRDDPHAALWEELSQNTNLQKQNKVLKEKVAKQAKQDKAVKNAKVSKKTIDGKTYYITDVPITSKDLVPYAMVEEKNKEIESLKKQIKARLDDIANKDRTIRTLEYRAKNDLEKVKELMLKPINDEITRREPYNGYLIYQGGVPEVENFIKKFRK